MNLDFVQMVAQNILVHLVLKKKMEAAKKNFVNKILNLVLVKRGMTGGIMIKNLDFAKHLYMEDVVEIKIILKDKVNANKYANLKLAHLVLKKEMEEAAIIQCQDQLHI